MRSLCFSDLPICLVLFDGFRVIECPESLLYNKAPFIVYTVLWRNSLYVCRPWTLEAVEGFVVASERGEEFKVVAQEPCDEEAGTYRFSRCIAYGLGHVLIT